MKGAIQSAVKDPFYRGTSYIEMVTKIEEKNAALKTCSDFVSETYFTIFNAKAKSSILMKKFAKLVQPTGEWFIQWKETCGLDNDTKLIQFYTKFIFKEKEKYLSLVIILIEPTFHRFSGLL